MLLLAAALILYNGKVVTADPSFSVSEAVAIEAGRIDAVGSNKAVLALKGPDTRVIDLHGKTVLPGLIDTHVHALEAGLSEFRGPLPCFTSITMVQDYIRERARVTPKGEWIIVPRTLPPRLKEMRFPTRRDLDVDTEHPVAFDGSYVWSANSLGLKISGITRNTPNPPGGEVVKDANGEPNGILRNASSLLKGIDRSVRFTEKEKLAALEQMLNRYAAAGLTAISDGGVSNDEYLVYQKLKDADRMPVRAVLTWLVDAQRPLDQVLAEIHNNQWTTNQGDDRLKFGSFKVVLDGGQSVGTAYQRMPYGPFGRQLYGQTDPAARGTLFIEPSKLLQIMRAARDKGWQLSAHVQGGGAVDTLLDAFEQLDRERPIAPTRSHVIHGSMQSPASIARMRKLGILASVQPDWLYFDVPALSRVFGLENLRWFYPLRSYIDNGIIVSGGSDHMIDLDKNHAVNPYNPFLNMWMSITRRTTAGDVVFPEECITREEALKMYTSWAAYMQFAEKSRGSIEPGKLADLVVVDRDFLTCPVDQIKDIEPVMTIVGGRVVFGHE